MWFKWVLMGLLMVGALSVVGEVGKPRKPVTPASAVVSVIITGLLIWGILVFWV